MGSIVNNHNSWENRYAAVYRLAVQCFGNASKLQKVFTDGEYKGKSYGTVALLSKEGAALVSRSLSAQARHSSP